MCTYVIIKERINIYMKKNFIFICIFALLLGLSYPNEISGEEAPTVLGEFAKLKDGNWINLTKKQKLEDFDFLYQTLEENYPYFHVLERKEGVNLEKEYKKIRKKIKNSKTDAGFFVFLNQFTASAKDIGHLGSIYPIGYTNTIKSLKNLIKEADLGKIDKERQEKIVEIYSNPKSKKSYKKLNKLLMPVYNQVMDYYASQDENQQEEPYFNVETKILESEKIAYINIKSFSMDTYKEDKKILFNFYEQVKDYPHIIFDFTENSGGGMSYFNDLILSPNIDHTLSTEVYFFMKDGKNNRQFPDIKEFKPISSMPKLPNMNTEDFENLDLAAKDEYKIEPLSKEKMLNGKIWILTSDMVFSSSEYAVMFSKSTGFATLVGTQTGGDGIGVDPYLISLPNSGLLVRYAALYGTTSDGKSSQEFGTTPDILSKKGESALETCLNAIKEITDKKK